jgi:ribose/xylose/arabinose/galactoside ABC-type transport system permease subunit
VIATLRGLTRQTALIIFAALFLLFTALLGSTFTGPTNLGNMSRQVAIDAPHVMGQVIVLIAGGIDISVGSVMAMSAALAIGLQGYGVGVAVMAALLFGATVGAVNGLLVTKGKIVPFVATLGTMSVVRGMVLTYTKQQSMPSSVESFGFWGGGSIGTIPMPLIISVTIMVVLWWFLRNTAGGRGLYAVGGNKETAYLAGVPVAKVQFTAFVLSGTLAAVSGVLLASRLESANAQTGIDTPLLSIAAAIIGGASLLGGRGGIVSAFLGIASLGTLSSGMNLLGVSTYVQIATKALVLIGVVVVDALIVNAKRAAATLPTEAEPDEPDQPEPDEPVPVARVTP